MAQQQHLDRLTSVDASFLHQEGPNAHMHIGGVLIFEGPPPEFAAYLDHIRSRLHLVPRYRQKLVTPPLETGRPLWADDPSFNLEYHVRHSALPAPGTERQLFQLTARIASQPLDRSKPLWENWLVEGLEGDRFAVISKTHHALVDGVSGVDLATVLFDLQPSTTPPPSDLEPWHPRPEPSRAELVLAGARGLVNTTASLVSREAYAITHPLGTLRLARDAVEGVGEIVWAGLNPAPDTPLNVEIGPHRRYSVVRQHLDDYKRVKNAFGGTVNDVVLTVVSGALARWLRSRGIRTEGLEMRALVPVSVRTREQQGSLGNKLTVMRGPLPIYIDDPVARLRFVRQAMDGLKESKQAVGAATLTAVNNLAPPTILAQASRLNFSTRLFNLLVTNIPGPQLPLYVLGRQLEDLFPVAFLPNHHALAIAIMSYNGGIDYGLLGDYDALPDIDVVADGIEASLEELLDAARQHDAREREAIAAAEPAAPSREREAIAAGEPAARRRRRGVRPPDDEPGDEEQEQQGTLVTPGRQSAPGPNGGPTPIVPLSGGRSKRGPAADMRAKRGDRARSGRKNDDG